MPSAKILVIRGGAIGDFILTLPVFAALREQFPGVHLEVLGYPRVTPLAVAGGLVHRAESIEARAMASFFARNGRLPGPLASYFEDFGVIISYLYDPDQIFRENVSRASKAQFIAGPHRPDESGALHATEVFLKPLERLAIFSPDPTPRLQFSAARSSVVLNAPLPTLERNWLALHPGSGSERKNWPEDRWRALLVRLAAETDAGFLLVGGEAEGDRLDRLAAAIPAGRGRIAQSLPLVNLAWMLKSCSGFVGHDSGISHLSAALGLPGVLLWGETNRQIWQPRADQMRLASSTVSLEDLSVEEVFAAVRSHLV